MIVETGTTRFGAVVDRPYVKGKFLYAGSTKFYIRGVTYGTFRLDDSGVQYPDQYIIDKDFALMANEGINCVRTYTVPPKHLLDAALKYNIKVMIGLPWEQHITFLDKTDTKKNIVHSIKEGVLSCHTHPAVLCYTIGNEIPASIVRWYGKHKIEDFLKMLYGVVKSIDPEGLVTYVNYPTTEYLDLSFLDFDCFNVYLETPEKLSVYISHLHNLCGNRPLVLAEIGLDSLRNGHEEQAKVLKWQIETVFGKGCAGMFVFSWTDEWWRGGFEIKDWDFGLVDRQRTPKPALLAVARAMAHVPFSDQLQYPSFSVIVCSYNGSATIRDTMEGLAKLKYPNFEVIVVNDGSEDNLAKIVSEYGVKLITTTNCGLSSARNTGMKNAKGEILAYIDDDAYPDEHWLHYLAYAYNNSNHSAMGGPNIVPVTDKPIAKCVANAPGGPVHVLLSDEIAEHVPGCNMSFRKEALREIGGFDPVYRAAGDDVDVCWRIQANGKTIGFHPSAVVWHHRRNSLKAYWKQQKGYGKAEALLEAKWPEKYNGFGHLSWAGRIYGNGSTLSIKLQKSKVFHGTWGTALFQSVYQPADGFFNAFPLMPEWYILSALLALLASLGFLWTPLLWVWPVVIASLIVVIVQALLSASKNVSLHPVDKKNFKYTALITLLHIVQPLARLYGRLNHGLTPWRKRRASIKAKFIFSFGKEVFTHWSEEWRAPEEWLKDIEKNLISFHARVKRGGDFEGWDLEASSGLFYSCRTLLAIEEHGGGKQYLRLKCWNTVPKWSIYIFVALTTLSVISAIDSQWIVCSVLSLLMFLLAAKHVLESSGCMNSVYTAFKSLSKELKVIELEAWASKSGRKKQTVR